jgi:hypothetical protein
MAKKPPVLDKSEVQESSILPDQYFHRLKGLKKKMSAESLDQLHDNAMILLNKYADVGQHKASAKLIFQIECIISEKQLLDLGIDTFVYRDDVEEYIDHIEKDVVKIMEIANYERDIPDEIAEAIKATRHIFTDYYIVFTDYTGKVEKSVEKERRKKDPIVFGVIHDKNRTMLLDRFYFIGDWEDEYCDLTLAKMVENFKKADPAKVIDHKIKTPEDIEELKSQLAKLEKNNRQRRSNMFEGETSQNPAEYVVNEKLSRPKRFVRAVRSFVKAFREGK